MTSSWPSRAPSPIAPSFPTPRRTPSRPRACARSSRSSASSSRRGSAGSPRPCPMVRSASTLKICCAASTASLVSLEGPTSSEVSSRWSTACSLPFSSGWRPRAPTTRGSLCGATLSGHGSRSGSWPWRAARRTGTSSLISTRTCMTCHPRWAAARTCKARSSVGSMRRSSTAMRPARGPSRWPRTMARSSSRSRYDPTYTYPILPVHPDSKAHLPWGQLVEAPWFGVAF
mmetsp:Transcript_51871/g.103225  ORF Transcript_51871/g.103225 Transcript_51871/m.103225 type:complete len:230 (-) Transcript_51871:514-1203(-)